MKEKPEGSRLYYIGGITGSGKTSVSREVAQNTPETVVVYGSKLLMEHFGCRSYDELNSVSDYKQKKGRIEIFSNLVGTEAKNVLVDGHYVIFIRDGKPARTVDEEWIVNFQALIHLITDPNIILERLLKDVQDFSRRIKNLIESDETVLDRIKRSQENSMDQAQNLANHISIPLRIVDNSSDLQKTAQKVKAIISGDKY